MEARDRGHRDLLERPDGRPERSDERPRAGCVQVPHGRHVDARRERAARPAQDDDAQGRIGAELPEGGTQDVDEGGREHVEWRAIEGEARKAALARDAK
jgi:hypothetical protein